MAPGTEPKLSQTAAGELDPAARGPVIMMSGASAAEPVGTAKPDQLARIEDKTARIEDKFARAEERMKRLELELEKATIRLDGVAEELNVKALRDELAEMRNALRGRPGTVTMFVANFIAALLAAGVVYVLVHYGIAARWLP